PFARMLTAAGINDENDNNVVKNVCARLDEIKSATNVSELGVAAHASRFDVICRPRGGDALIGWMDNQISLEFKTRETNKGSRYFSTI
ncbi:helicase RepA family protein, partial [Mycobacterium tuberculosis]|nr:helicase RepA family protein [Mycobacterium tuberculosis]